MGRLDHARPAVRPSLRARAVISGPAGSGKTRTGLIVATVLADGNDFLVIDTEKESALTYADDFTFTHLRWAPPFDPRELADEVLAAGRRYPVVMVDSLSHFWRGEGGTLEIADGRFTGWKDARPAQNNLVDALLECEAHVIACARAKVEHVQEQDDRGRHVVRKVGMQVVQSDDLEYEVNVAAVLEMDHSLTVSKSRATAVPVGRTFKAARIEEFATAYKEWLAGGEDTAEAEVIDGFRKRVAALPDGVRGDCKAAYFAALGRPEQLRPSQVDEAERIIAEHEALAEAEVGS